MMPHTTGPTQTQVWPYHMSHAAPRGEFSTNIPVDVLRGIQLHMIIPSHTPIDDDSIPLILHLRLQSEDTDMHDQLWVLGFEANIMQVVNSMGNPWVTGGSPAPTPA